ncbi:hypothetical protein EDD11_005687 [Mortierella claussenii]|nr:hypothetical protein EDD11_005687 [Mortierella claussenii]
MTTLPGDRPFGNFGSTESVDMNSMPSLSHSTGSDIMDLDSLPLEQHRLRIQAYGQQLQQLQNDRLQRQQGQGLGDSERTRTHGQEQQQEQSQELPPALHQPQVLYQAHQFPLFSIHAGKQQDQLYQYHQLQQQQQQQQQQQHQPHQAQQHSPEWSAHDDWRPTVDHTVETEMPSLTFSSDEHSTDSFPVAQSASPRLPPLSPSRSSRNHLVGPGPGPMPGQAPAPTADHVYFMRSTLTSIPPEMTEGISSPLPHFDYYAEFPQRQQVTFGGNGVIKQAFWPLKQCNVILKSLIDTKLTQARLEVLFDKEVEVMRICGNHDNLVEFYGVATKREPEKTERYMIMRLCDQGDLVKLLDRPRHMPESPSLTERLFLALDIASGLNHLFQCGFHHGDLHPKNIVIDTRRTRLPSDQHRGRYQARLTDFGLRRIRGNKNAVSSQPLAGVWQFMAPERIFSNNQTRYNVLCDIFALGVIYWYLMASKYPLKGLTPFTPFVRETRVEGTPDWFHVLYTQAWAEDPRERQQSLDEIVQVLEYYLGVSQSWQQFRADQLQTRPSSSTPSPGHERPATDSGAMGDQVHYSQQQQQQRTHRQHGTLVSSGPPSRGGYFVAPSVPVAAGTPPTLSASAKR